MDSQVGAAWIGVIPTLGALLFVVILVVINRERLAVVLTRITRLSVAGVQVDFAIEDLRNARPEQPVTQRSATLLEARIARNLDAVRGRRVLWVDDDPKGNRAERRLLRSAGIWVENVVTTVEALDRLRRDDYDVVITDQAREGSDTAGEELARRASELGEHVPFVAYVRKLDDRPTPSVFNGVTNRPDQLVHLLLDIFERTAAAA
jgi:CheY-like chemotaxis protein